MSMTHHNSNQGTDHLVFQSPPLWVHWQQKKYKVWILNSGPNEAQLEDQKPRKAQEGYLEEGKNREANKRHKKRQNQRKSNKSSKTPPNILNASSPP
jgi:hypothetical protein